MNLIIGILISAVGFYAGAQFLRGVTIKSFVEAIIVAVVISVLNVTLGLFLKILSLGILSFGIFSLFLDAILIQVADYFLNGFKVKNFWWALALALVVSVVGTVMHSVILP